MSSTRFELVQKKTRNSYGYATRQPGTRKFCAIDGEGLGAEPDRYVLLGVGQEQYENPNGITWKEAFEFLYSQYLRFGSGTSYVGFYLGYDFTQILKSLPSERAFMLLSAKGKAVRQTRIPGRDPFPVEYQGWQFDILANKRLKIRPKMCHCKWPGCKCPKASWMYICDAGGFWQSSFLEVINPKNWTVPIVSDEEFALIEKGKDSRGVAVLDDDMRTYNRLENGILEKCMEELSRGFEHIGIYLTPRQWFGPGQAAAKWLDGRLPNRDEWVNVTPKWFLEAATASYYGGWFELMIHGFVERDIHEYDINSAYPHIIRTLPCLLHGTYSKGTGYPFVDDSQICLVRARLNENASHHRTALSKRYIGSMLHRDTKGNISRPVETGGWFWWDELQAAKSAGFVDDITVYEWMKYEKPTCKCRNPLQEMEDLYRLRIEVGKDTPLGKACKLVYNSAYGKFAQSVGLPKFGNPIYASRTTSGCRTIITNAIATHPKGPKAVAMVATDAVFFLSEHPDLTIGKELGQWSHELRPKMTLFKPGVYWDQKIRDDINEGVKPKFKSRGVNARDFAASTMEIDDTFMRWIQGEENDWPQVKFKSSFSMTSLLQALQRNDWNLAGVVKHDVELKQDSRPVHKRRPKQIWDSEFEVYRTLPWTKPFGSRMNVDSTPYKKRFGMDDPFSDETKEELGVTDDGTVVDTISWVLRK